MEHQAFQHSEANYFLVVCGFAYILTGELFQELLNGQYRVVQGRDYGLATGMLVPVQDLNSLGRTI